MLTRTSYLKDKFVNMLEVTIIYAQICNRLDNENQHSCVNNKRRSLAIISACLEQMNAKKFLTDTNLPKLKMRQIIFNISIPMIYEKILNHILKLVKSEYLKFNTKFLLIPRLIFAV